MAKTTDADPDFGPEFWLHILSDAARRYAAEGGSVQLAATAAGLQLTLAGIDAECPDLKQEFVDLMEATS